MKRLMTILALIPMCFHHCSGQERTSLGTDLISVIIRGRANMNIEYAFCDKWSAGAAISVNAGIWQCHDQKEKDHWSELYGNNVVTFDSDEDSFVETVLLFSYWPHKAYDGLRLSIGSIIDDSMLPDICAGIGYYCRIWKGLRAAIMYNAGLMECMNMNFKPAEGIKIGINYVF